MLFRPDSRDFRLIGLYGSRVLFGVGLAMLIPAAVAFLLHEANAGWAFVVGASLTVLFSQGVQWISRTEAPLTRSHAMAAVGWAWLMAPVFGAVPLLLSGHYASYLDAYFECMSGFATIGQTLANDVDHMARSINLWRHLMQFIGGQGIIIVFLTVFAASGGAIGSLYVGEAREEKILPNVVNTARFIWRVAITYAIVGISLLWAALVGAGMSPALSFYHGTNLFMAAFDTGGFATMSSSVGFYRSPMVEVVLLPIMIAGGCSFAVHHQLWQRRGYELTRNIESRVLGFSILLLFAVMCIGLARVGLMTDAGALMRHGFFHAVSAHTTTGLATVPGRLYTTDWGALAPATLVIGMALGGMASSTAGGIKALRIGLLLKSVRRDIRMLLLPADAVVIETYHARNRRVLRNPQVTAAVMILLLWLLLYLVGTLAGLFYGYDIQSAFFDSTAAASSGGLSVGIVRPDMETPLKLVYIAQMVLGRLEFLSLFVLAGYVAAMVRGRT